MKTTAEKELREALQRWNEADELALESLVPHVYEELRRIASSHLRREDYGVTFQTTELINEAYVKLANLKNPVWHDRTHFFALAARAMRHILVDHARAKNAQKRGGTKFQITLADSLVISPDQTILMVDLDESLQKLAEMDERKALVVELKYFGGLTYDEIAELIGVSPETVKRDLRFSRSWLMREISS